MGSPTVRSPVQETWDDVLAEAKAGGFTIIAIKDGIRGLKGSIRRIRLIVFRLETSRRLKALRSMRTSPTSIPAGTGTEKERDPGTLVQAAGVELRGKDHG